MNDKQQLIREAQAKLTPLNFICNMFHSIAARRPGELAMCLDMVATVEDGLDGHATLDAWLRKQLGYQRIGKMQTAFGGYIAYENMMYLARMAWLDKLYEEAK